MTAEPPASPDVEALPLAPYPGLRPFREQEATIFFGRERQCEELTELMEDQNLLLIHGSSGCGKSSLVAAGLLPFLHRDYRRAGQKLRHAIFRPSSGPYQALASALAETIGAPGSAGGDVDRAYDYWARHLLGEEVVAAIERRLEEIEVDGLCLVVDQFEEIFTWQRKRRASDVDLLIAFLATVLKASSERVFVLITMRSDYIGACGRLPALAGVINKAQYLLPVLGLKDVARAIAEPARMFGGGIEPELLERLLLIATTGTDPLPIVQHALKRMFDLRPRSHVDPWTLTLGDLEAVSGDASPLSQHADQIAAALEQEDADAGAAMEWIFRSLFDVEKSGEAIRRPRDFDELVAVVGLTETAAAQALTTKIVDAFAKEGANFLVVSRAEPRRVDISHEALLRQWTRLIGAGPGQPGWKRREIEDGLMWRSLASPMLEKGVLRGRSLEAAKEFLDRMRVAPERARRYLSEEGVIDDVTMSREWRRMTYLIRRSIWQRRSIWLGVTLSVLVALAVALLWLQRQHALRETAEVQARVQLGLATERKTVLDTIVSGSDRASLASEQVDSSVAAALDSVTDANLDQSGYIWIGDTDGSVATLEAFRARTPASYQTVRAGNCYRPRYRLVLRSGLPDPLNRSAPRVGSVSVGQQVCALEPPQRSASHDQWWLRVATVTAYLHVTSAASAELDGIRRNLAALHYFLPPAEETDAAADKFEVRFCQAADGAAARSLASYLSQRTPRHPFRPVDIGGWSGCASASPGYLEVWVDTERPNRPRQEPAHAAAQPDQADR